MILYTIKDDKAGMFFEPWLSNNDQVAIRNFSILCNDKTTTIGKYPNDYSLYCLGEYDERTGEIKPSLTYLTNGSGLVEVHNGNI